MASKANPLPLNDTLRDLALLRACDVELSSVLPYVSSSNDKTAVDESVDRSYEFVHEARAALKVLNRAEVEKQGSRVEDIRGTLEDVSRGLESHS